MIKLKFCLPLIVLTVFIFSCKKDKDNAVPLTPGTGPAYPDYSQLKVGNYWVYQIFDVDSLGNSTPTNDYDSCYVQKDTIINGVVYFKMCRPCVYFPGFQDFWLERDSLHYVVNSSGDILFSSQDFTTVFDSYYITATPDTVAHVVTKMEDHNAVANTPAGYFLTSDFRITYYMYPNWLLNGSVRPKHTRYAKNTGIVVETLPFYTMQPNYFERRLIRYHLN